MSARRCRAVFRSYAQPWSAGADDLSDKPEHQQEWKATRTQTEPITALSRPLYFACNHFVDRLIGRIVDAVDQQAADNTWVIYCTDHGDFLGGHWLAAKGPAMYDEITRVPLIVRPPPAQRRAQVISEPVSLVDIAPTVLEIAGVAVPPIIDGKDLGPAIASGSAADRGDVMIEWNRFEVGHDSRGGLLPIRCIVRNNFKFVVNLFSSDELYDYDVDPHECTNLINDERYAEIRLTLHDALLAQMDADRDPFRGPQWERGRGAKIASRAGLVQSGSGQTTITYRRCLNTRLAYRQRVR